MDIQFDRITTGIEKYIRLMKWVHETNVSEDSEFQRFYNGFYRMRQRPSAFYACYYQYLEQNKNNSQLTFSDILLYLYEQTGQIHASFGSKLLATTNPSMPIGDKYVLQNLGLKAPYSYANNRLTRVVQLYDQITQWYETEEAKYYLEIFNQHYPNIEMTDTKKIDWILWGIRST